ncbi:RNA polymerase sigma factor [Propionibacteriaceae bacterium Y1923]|uniref:RNA polymerase sigma factor n=1 Tax=Aestuariimicrobium sp. Y1814 TaxID=3418742 RepID=UPI003C19C063
MDEASFDNLYQTSFNRLVAQIYAMCGNLTEAQDCVQEAFIRAWDKRKKLDQAQSPEAWVRTVAYRLAVSRWRKNRKAYRDPDRAVESPVSREPNPDRVALDRALAQISPEQRRVIVLHHFADLTVAEIAQEVGAPAGTVKARLSRGRAALAPFLTDTAEVRHA